jgi:hypothetical protein
MTANKKKTDLYGADSSALIHAWRWAYPLKNFPPFWTGLDNLVEEKRLYSSIEVLNEIKRKDGDVYE